MERGRDGISHRAHGVQPTDKVHDRKDEEGTHRQEEKRAEDGEEVCLGPVALVAFVAHPFAIPFFANGAVCMLNGAVALVGQVGASLRSHVEDIIPEKRYAYGTSSTIATYSMTGTSPEYISAK